MKLRSRKPHFHKANSDGLIRGATEKERTDAGRSDPEPMPPPLTRPWTQPNYGQTFPYSPSPQQPPLNNQFTQSPYLGAGPPSLYQPQGWAPYGQMQQVQYNLPGMTSQAYQNPSQWPQPGSPMLPQQSAPVGATIPNPSGQPYQGQSDQTQMGYSNPDPNNPIVVGSGNGNGRHSSSGSGQMPSAEGSRNASRAQGQASKQCRHGYWVHLQ